MIKIIIDSASDITEDEAKELGILFAPIEVSFGEEQFMDGVNIKAPEFYDRLVKTKEFPKTSLINEYRWEEYFKNATSDGSDVIAITLSSKISGTYKCAKEAAEKSNGKVHVVDSLSATIGERLLCYHAQKLISEGKSVKEIVDELNEKKLKLQIIAVIDTLKYLKMGGRVSATTAFFGEMLSIKPVISVIDGEVKVIGKARGGKNGNILLNDLITKKGGFDFSMPYGLIFGGNDKSNLERFIKDGSIHWNENSAEIRDYQIGCTIGAHVGPGAYGVCFFEK